MTLDQIDRAIITELTRDGRLSVAALAERVHISRAHCYSRLNRLQEDGVITGFSATIDPVKAGLGASGPVGLPGDRPGGMPTGQVCFQSQS